MSGHSKWASIKRSKGAADAKRGVVFSKLARLITLAAKNGADPEMNFQLRIAIDQAKAANLPSDNIKRAIERASGGAGGAVIEEMLLEIYGPAGVALLVEAATDNRNRTLSEVRALLNRHHAKLAESGAVQYLFEKKGLIHARFSDVEALELAAIEADADDVEVNGDEVLVWTNPTQLEAVRQALAVEGTEIADYGLSWESKATVTMADPAQAEQLTRLHDALDDLDDVTRVSSNFDAGPSIEVS